MPTALFIVEKVTEGGGYKLPSGEVMTVHDLPVGAMWPCECHGQRGWMIRVPGADTWPDGHVWPNRWCTLLGDEQGTPWSVSGEPPKLTVSPSIWINSGEGEARGEWHGHIIDGEIRP